MPQRIKHLLFLFVVFSAANVMAQPRQWDIQRLTVNDGLPENDIRSLAQDDQGFIWVATAKSGLVRYDGYSFVKYRHDPRISSSILNDSLSSVYVDRAGDLWIGTNSGLDKLDRKTDSFVHYRRDPSDDASLASSNVTTLLEDNSGRFWVGTTAGLYLMDRSTGAFTPIRHKAEDPNSLADDRITELYQDRSGRIWIGTRGGLHRLNSQSRNDVDEFTFIRYQHNSDDPQSISDNQVRAIYEDSDGNFWVGTGQQTLHHMDRTTGVFTGFQSPEGLFGVIDDIAEDASGGLWVVANVAGAIRIRMESGTLVTERLPGLVSLQGINKVFSSSDGTLWIASNAGLIRVNPAVQPITFHPIMAPDVQRPVILSLAKSGEDQYWIGTEEGLLEYDETSGRARWYFHDPLDSRSLADNTVLGVLVDRSGSLWISTVFGFHKMDSRTGRITRVMETIVATNSVQDNNGHIWVGSFGLFEIDPVSSRRIQYLPESGNPGSIASRGVQSLRLGRDNALWIGLLNGFSRYSGESQQFTNYRPSEEGEVTSPDVHAFIEDKLGRLWYGSPHSEPGLNRFDSRTGTFEYVPSSASTVYSFLEDDTGNIWMATDAGLLMFDMESEGFTSYEDHPVLRDWDVGGYKMGAYKDEEGILHFGAVGGIYSIDPVLLRQATHSAPPKVALTELYIGADRVVHGKDAPVQSPIWEADTITLSNSENTFSIVFAALYFKDSAHNQHEYMLENYDQTWREAGLDRRADYVKVPSGDYIFRARAKNADGVWSEEDAVIRIRVLPPWWRSTWAYIVYGLLFLAGVIAVDRIQRRRLIARERERTRTRELEQARQIEKAYTQLKTTQAQLVQAEKMASLGQLTAGIAHEIKNPLNFVNNFAGLNAEMFLELKTALDNGDSEEAQQLVSDLSANMEKIEEHGLRADAIVRAMMEHASGGTSEREPKDLNSLVSEHIDLAYHGKRARDSELRVTIERDFDDTIGMFDLVPQEIGRVVLNLVGNAIDAVNEPDRERTESRVPTITVSTRKTDQHVEIRVSDDGPGIPQDIMDKVFEPFFTTKPTGKGTGLGLSLSYEIVTQGYGGTMTVESKEGEGATFIVTLPFSKKRRDSSQGV